MDIETNLMLSFGKAKDDMDFLRNKTNNWVYQIVKDNRHMKTKLDILEKKIAMLEREKLLR